MKPYLALKASAGSGKTFSLVVRILELLLSGANINEILALTFTKKAANEMKIRVLNALIDLKNSKNRALFDELIRLGFKADEIDKKVPKILDDFLSALPKITTIDSFLHQILRKFCFYAGVRYNFEVASSNEKKIKKLFLDSLDESALLKISELIKSSGRDLEYFLKIFRIMISNEHELKRPKSSDAPYAKFEIAKKSVMENANLIKEFVINSQDASSSALNAVEFENVDSLLEKGKTWLTKNSLSEFSYFKKIYKNELDDYFEILKNSLKAYYEAREELYLNEIFDFFENYKSVKERYSKSTNSLTFDDVSKIVHKLLDEMADKEFLYFRLDEKISHILIDEFQDTSTLQYEILKPLIDEIRAGDGQKTNRSFFIVGDTKQSIYRFRGSKPELFDHVARGLEVQNLPKNYRSKKVIVDFVNEVFKDKFYDFVPQHADDDKSGGYVEVCENDEVFDELKKRIYWLLKAGVPQDDIAILTFNNDDILEAEEFLKEQIDGLKIITETSSKLINRQEPQAIISLFKYAVLGDSFYKAQGLALLGIAPFGYADFVPFDKSAPPYSLIHQIMEKYSLFSQSSILLLEESFRFDDVYEFLESVEMLDRSVPLEELEGIRILTIHKSKGLEFPHLLVLDRLKKEPPDSEPLIFSSEFAGDDRIFYRSKHREYFDTEYKKRLETNQKTKEQDRLNLLYVALTRAKESLIIIKKSEKSEFDKTAIKARIVGALEIFKKQENEKLENEKLDFENRFYGSQEKSKKDREFLPNDFHAQNLGLALHNIFEFLDGIDMSSMDSSYSATINRFGLKISKDEIEQIKEQALSALKGEPLHGLKDCKIYKELPFSIGEKIGRVDLMAICGESYLIFDFKYAQKSSDTYSHQIDFYKNSIKKIAGVEPKGYLLFLGSKEPKVIEL